MKNQTNKRIEIYVNSTRMTCTSVYAVARFIEKEKMPLEAVREMKKIVDNYLSLTECGTLLVETYSTEIISFLYEYGKLKKYKVQIFYRSKKIGIEGIFKKFNAVFRYIDKVTEIKE